MLATEEKQNDQQEPAAWPFIIPFVAFMAIASRSPNVTGAVDDVAVRDYLYLVITQVVVGTAIIVYCLRKYLREFPFRIDLWAFVVGVGGVIAWVWLSNLGLEAKALTAVGLESWIPERVGFDPFTQITNPERRMVFLVFRFTLLAAIVPIGEELFLRGWFVRYIENPDWYTVKLSAVGLSGIGAVAVYAIATHPGEAIAAVVWFTLVTILMIKTGKFWNCVVAHAVTNLLLGIYVVQNSQWHFW